MSVEHPKIQAKNVLLDRALEDVNSATDILDQLAIMDASSELIRAKAHTRHAGKLIEFVKLFKVQKC